MHKLFMDIMYELWVYDFSIVFWLFLYKELFNLLKNSTIFPFNNSLALFANFDFSKI